MIQVVRGMRDLINQDALLQETIENNFKQVFTSYGYTPTYTPTVENFELFNKKGTSGSAIKKEIYYFKDKSERELALRFELTSSLARIASNEQLKMPFKRYQIGEVYRYDRPQAKRYRAFYQADIDILGIENIEAELEIMFVIRDCFKKFGLTPIVKFNSRKLLNELLTIYAKENKIETMRILDKADKLNEQELLRLLKEKNINEQVLNITKMSLDEITKIVKKNSEGLIEVKSFLDACKKNDLNFVNFDPSLARGLDYYTGIVFEIKLDNGPSVGGGGRFDNLIEKYGGKKTPAVGLGIGISRILDFLKEKGTKISLEGIFLIGLEISNEEKNFVAKELRKNFFVETNLKEMRIRKAIDYAEKKGYDYIGIIGENELKNSEITIKNIKNGEQKTFKTKKISDIKSFLQAPVA